MKVAVGTLDEVLQIQALVPEFDRKTTKQEMVERLTDLPQLVLVAYADGKAVGYQIGYQISQSEFYIWLSGVLPEYRNQGIANALRAYQERWAIKAGYQGISVKSMNRFSNMLRFLIANQYQIVGYAAADNKFAGKVLFYKSII